MFVCEWVVGMSAVKDPSSELNTTRLKCTTQQKVSRNDTKRNAKQKKHKMTAQKKAWLLCLPPQVIQSIRAADLDSSANGKFSYYLPAEDPVKPNFTLRDNGGTTLSQSRATCCLTVKMLSSCCLENCVSCRR